MIDSSLAEFIDDPGTVDFVARNTQYFMDFLTANPQIVPTQLIAGRYLIVYANRNQVSVITQTLGSSFISAIPLVLGLLDTAALESAGILQVQEQPYLDLQGRGVLIGIARFPWKTQSQTCKYNRKTFPSPLRAPSS